MNRRKLISDDVFDLVVYSSLALAAFVVFYPLYFVLIASFSSPEAVNNGYMHFLPIDFSLAGYEQIFQDNRIWTGYRNTIIYTVAGTALNVTITVMAGYALSRKDLVGRNIIMGIFVLTMYFGGGLIPTYLMIDAIGLLNNPLVMIVSGAVSVWNLIICRTFFASTISLEIMEAAFMDGCRNGRFFARIVLPLSKSIVAILVLYYAVGHWNAFFNAMIYLNKQSYYPLQLVLRDILVQNEQVSNGMTDAKELIEKDRIAQTIKYGVIIVSSLPVLVLYPFVQRHFVKGVMIGSLKG